MSLQGVILVWGTLAASVIFIVVGFSINDSVLASLLRIFGILGVCGWFAFALYILRAMNTDI